MSIGVSIKEKRIKYHANMKITSVPCSWCGADEETQKADKVERVLFINEIHEYDDVPCYRWHKK